MAAGLLFTALIPCAIAGLALINTGLGRARGAAHAMVTALCAVAVAAIAFICIGYALQTSAPSIGIHFAGRSWNLIGAGPLFLRGVETSGIHAVSLALLQLLSVALAALIPLGTGADRWRFTAVCYSTALLAAFTYPVFTHWSTGGGWLARLGVDYGLGRGFVDGGSGAIQSVGGLTALAIGWILGPRRGKFGSQGRSLAIPGHNRSAGFDRLFSGVDRLAGAERRLGGACLRGRAASRRTECDQHHADSVRGGAGSRSGDQSRSLRPSRRITDRQRLAVWIGDQRRGMRPFWRRPKPRLRVSRLGSWSSSASNFWKRSS